MHTHYHHVSMNVQAISGIYSTYDLNIGDEVAFRKDEVFRSKSTIKDILYDGYTMKLTVDDEDGKTFEIEYKDIIK
jgi:hypothetical protein